ncbi:CBS and ACT domain-containing protein [Thermodesulforhabdus norvegica]|uniref:Acetoin utilization protein AcuB n=1 Tax=Thermodesulforhabdus norvegica TaxID=39841 RepID=A0A1I4UX01_9BACT|nr:CBS and ACT domain-containing protein [Thermodesulforhabdus norvegica]SFM93492.1 acetoin utilization protein AcuB [Thermodesulforhabdus norvegica]
MFVGWHMTTKLITITPDTPMLKAREIMDEHRISHLPVTDNKGRLLGLVTDRDLREAWASPASTLSVYELTYILQKVTVEGIMKKNLITATPDMTIERAALIMHDQKIGCLPVLSSDNRLIGIITTADLMAVLLKAMGMSDDSGRLTVLVRDRVGVLSRVTSILAEKNINIRSVMVHPLPGYEGVWQLLLRFRQGVLEEAARVLEEAGFKVLKEYQEDLTPYLPE